MNNNKPKYKIGDAIWIHVQSPINPIRYKYYGIAIITNVLPYGAYDIKTMDSDCWCIGNHHIKGEVTT
jgi:hypothetical protein